MAVGKNAFASDNSSVATIDRVLYEQKEIVFPSLNELLKANTDRQISQKDFLLEKNQENNAQIEKFIYNLDLAALGEKDLELRLIKDLDELSQSEGYIEKYELYLPSSSNYYGVYNNRNFRDYYTVVWDSYQRKSYDPEKHLKWAKGLISSALNFAPKVISLPYTVLDATTRSDIITFSTDLITYNGSDEVTKHYITIEDINNVLGGGYWTVIIDEARVNTTDIVVDYASPTKPTKTDNVSYMKSINCSTWSYTKTAQMTRGYNQFIYNPGVALTNYVGRFSIPW